MLRCHEVHTPFRKQALRKCSHAYQRRLSLSSVFFKDCLPHSSSSSPGYHAVVVTIHLTAPPERHKDSAAIHLSKLLLLQIRLEARDVPARVACQAVQQGLSKLLIEVDLPCPTKLLPIAPFLLDWYISPHCGFASHHLQNFVNSPGKLTHLLLQAR